MGGIRDWRGIKRREEKIIENKKRRELEKGPEAKAAGPFSN
jgi:hypothetical protein